MIFRIVLLLLTCCIAANVEAAALQIVPGAYSSGKPYVRCAIDGVATRCFVDTGSGMTLVANSKRFAAYTNAGVTSFKSASGIAQRAETIRVGGIQIDDVTFQDVKIGRVNFRGAENTLGIDLLGRQPFAFRFGEKNALILNAARPELPLTTLGVSAQGLLTIPIGVTSAGEVRALWDTGVAVTSVDQSFIQANPENFTATKNHARGVDGAGNAMLLPMYRAKKIVIGEQIFEDVRVIAVDLSVLREGVSKDIQAIVGFNVIRKAEWFFDRKSRLWKCE
jgi:hypothetical protein